MMWYARPRATLFLSGFLSATLFSGLVVIFLYSTAAESSTTTSFSAADEVFDPRPNIRIGYADRYSLAELTTWERPAGPFRVGIQVGHLFDRASDLPEELAGLARNEAGAVWGEYTERDVMYSLAMAVATDLERSGVVVDILPAVIPPGYQADTFMSLHADGNSNARVRGFKIAAPSRDFSGVSQELVDHLYETYAKATNLPVDESITSGMRAYYAFNWNRYEHAVHPLTPAVIVETGYLTNPDDRKILMQEKKMAAQGLSEGVMRFLTSDAPHERSLAFATAVPTFPLMGTVVCLDVRSGITQRERCERGIQTADGRTYAVLIQRKDVELPEEGQIVTLRTGDFIPLASFDNFLWYRYEVEGEIIVAPGAIR